MKHNYCIMKRNEFLQLRICWRVNWINLHIYSHTQPLDYTHIISYNSNITCDFRTRDHSFTGVVEIFIPNPTSTLTITPSTDISNNLDFLLRT